MKTLITPEKAYDLKPFLDEYIKNWYRSFFLSHTMLDGIVFKEEETNFILQQGCYGYDKNPKIFIKYNTSILGVKSVIR